MSETAIRTHARGSPDWGKRSFRSLVAGQPGSENARARPIDLQHSAHLGDFVGSLYFS